MKIQTEGKSTVLYLPEFFRGIEVRKVIEAAHETMKAGTAEVIIDFSGTDMIDSSGIGALVAVAKDSKTSGCALILRSLNQDIHELFRDSDLDKIFDIRSGETTSAATVDLFKNYAEIRLNVAPEVKGDVYIMHLSGVMNHPIGSQFFKQQFLLALSEHRKVLLDLEELTFFDSLSVGVMLTMNKLLHKTGGNLRICNINYIIDDLFKTLSLNQIIECHPTIQTALDNWMTLS